SCGSRPSEVDSDDLHQTVFINIWTQLQGASIPFNGVGSVWEQLEKLAQYKLRHATIDQIRRSKRWRHLQSDVQLTESKDSDYMWEQIFRILKRAIDRLPGAFRETLMLYHFSGLSCPEIAQQQSVPEGTVGSRINRGEKLINKDRIYQAECDDIFGF